MKQCLLPITILLITSLLLSFSKVNPSSLTWYKETKTVILEQSALKSDSMDIQFRSDSTFKKYFIFSNKHVFRTRTYKKGSLRAESYFSGDGNFELRREFCDNGTISFEGIAYKTSLYGPLTSFYCNGKIQEQGFRYQSEKIGVWKTFDENGKLSYETDYKFESALDSLPQISK